MICKVKNLTKKFGDMLAIYNLSFHIQTGDVTGFVGPNGAGKTTALRIMATLEVPSSGDIEIDGCSIISHPEMAHRYVGFVPDSLAVQKNVTIHEYLDFFARAYGFKNPQRSKIIEEIEEFTNLVALREKSIETLSKGMKQRVSIARALINDPPIILMDEPAAGLDPRARIELRELLKILAQKNKMVLISSHILSDLDEICSSAVIVERGKLLKFGNVKDILADTEKSRTGKEVSVTPVENIEGLMEVLLLEPYVSNVRIVADSIEFAYQGDEKALSNMMLNILNKGFVISGFKNKKHSLESVFMSITKGELQ